jgi:ArsR family transcriptional regulator
MLELLAPRITAGTGVDASRAMLALARARLSRPGLTHCVVRLGDMYRLPMADAAFDHVILQMVLHYAEDPAAALAEAARVLRPGGTLVIVDLAPHDNADCMDRLAHRWPGFADTRIAELLGPDLAPPSTTTVPGPMAVRIWTATRFVACSALVLETTP